MTPPPMTTTEAWEGKVSGMGEVLRLQRNVGRSPMRQMLAIKTIIVNNFKK